MRFWRFKLGFVTGYAVATLRHAKDADPLIRRLQQVERTAQVAREWWRGLDDDHPMRRFLDSGRYAA